MNWNLRKKACEWSDLFLAKKDTYSIGADRKLLIYMRARASMRYENGKTTDGGTRGGSPRKVSKLHAFFLHLSVTPNRNAAEENESEFPWKSLIKICEDGNGCPRTNFCRSLQKASRRFMTHNFSKSARIFCTSPFKIWRDELYDAHSVIFMGVAPSVPLWSKQSLACDRCADILECDGYYDKEHLNFMLDCSYLSALRVINPKSHRCGYETTHYKWQMG